VVGVSIVFARAVLTHLKGRSLLRTNQSLSKECCYPTALIIKFLINLPTRKKNSESMCSRTPKQC